MRGCRLGLEETDMGGSQQRRGEVLTITWVLVGGNLWKPVNTGDAYKLTLVNVVLLLCSTLCSGQFATDLAGWQWGSLQILKFSLGKEAAASWQPKLTQPSAPAALPRCVFLRPAWCAGPAWELMGWTWVGGKPPACVAGGGVGGTAAASSCAGSGCHGATAWAQVVWHWPRCVENWLGFSLLLQHCLLQELWK